MTEQDQKKIKAMTVGGKILSSTLQEISKQVAPGVKLIQLNDLAEKFIREAGAEPAFLNYQPEGAEHPFPASICASLNEEVVHGLPDDRQLKDGDIISIDLGVKYQGFYTDSAITLPVGEISSEIKHLLRVTKEALNLAIKECRSGKTLGDIGFAIQTHAQKNKLTVIKSLTGHGVGEELHAHPTVLNFGQPGEGEALQPGMTLALEPMFSLGSGKIKQLPSEGYATEDDSLSAHFEHTIAITDDAPLILTK